MPLVVQAQPEEEKKQSRKRYDHLRMIEKKMQEVQLSTNEAEAHATEGYEKLDFEVKNNGKYMTTFPYPYMNGYLHLGKSISRSHLLTLQRYSGRISAGRNTRTLPFKGR